MSDVKAIESTDDLELDTFELEIEGASKGELIPVDDLSPQENRDVNPERPKWMSDEDDAAAKAMATALVGEVKANPADVRLMLRVGQLGEEGTKQLEPSIALYEKRISGVMDDNQQGSAANLTLMELHKQVELVNPAVLKTKPIPTRLLGWAGRKKLPGAQQVIDMIYENRESVKSTIDGLSRNLIVIADDLRENVEDLACIYDGLLKGQRLIERDIYVGQLAIQELTAYLGSMDPGPEYDNVQQFLADMTAQVVLLMDEENLNLQFFAGAQGVVKLTMSQLKNITGLGRLLKRSVIANLGLSVAARELQSSMEVTEQMRTAIGTTVTDTAGRLEDMGGRMAEMRAKGGVDLDKLEEACQSMERFFAQQARANEVIITQGAVSMNRLADMSSRLRKRAEGGHAGVLEAPQRSEGAA